MQPASHVAPTRVRYFTLCLCIAMAVLLYLDRYALSSVTGTLLVELNVNKEQLGSTVFFPFFFAYALLQIPAGWLSDTFGARRMLALYVATWSLATISMGLVNGLAVLFLVRFVLGLAQAGAYPTAASLIKRWFPYGSRGLANSLVSMGGRAGGLLAFAATPFLMRLVGRWLGWETGRWRPVFALYGALGLGWVALFVWRYRDSPRAHPWCNEQEIELISPASETAPAPVALPRSTLPPLAIFASRQAGLMCVINFCVNAGWVFLVSWLPLYLTETYGHYLEVNIGDSLVVSNLMTALTGLVGMIGNILGGLATDRLVVRLGPLWGRRLPGLASGVVVTAIYLLAPHLPNVWWFVAAMAGISFSIDFSLSAIWASYQDIGGRHVASFLGCGNMFGSFGAALFTWQSGRFADRNQWNSVFLLSAAAMIVATISWLLFDPTKRAAPDDLQ